MNQDIYILYRSGGEYEDHYTLAICYVMDMDEANDLAKRAKEEWLAAILNNPFQPPVKPNLEEATSEDWDAYHEADHVQTMEVIAKRKAAMTIDPDAPIDAYETPRYSVGVLRPFKPIETAGC